MQTLHNEAKVKTRDVLSGKLNKTTLPHSLFALPVLHDRQILWPAFKAAPWVSLASSDRPATQLLDHLGQEEPSDSESDVSSDSGRRPAIAGQTCSAHAYEMKMTMAPFQCQMVSQKLTAAWPSPLCPHAPPGGASLRCRTAPYDSAGKLIWPEQGAGAKATNTTSARSELSAPAHTVLERCVN